MNTQVGKIQRNGDVEVFRCLLMFAIVTYHCFIFGPNSDCKSLWTFFFTVLTCWHVDGFVAISGWYGIRFSWQKFIQFVGHFAFYGLLSWLYVWCVGGACPKLYRCFLGGWFGSTYLALLLLSPYVNRGIDCLWSKSKLLAYGWVGVLGIYLFVSWITGRFEGRMVPVQTFGFHSVVLMVYVYSIARVLRRTLEGRTVLMRYPLMGMIYWHCSKVSGNEVLI